MKYLYGLLAIFLFAFSGFAQSPELFNYQSVLRDLNGNIVANQNVNLRISILQGSSSGTVLYEETHAASSSASGLISLQIGSGTVTSGSFSGIDWASAAHYVKVEADASGGTNYDVLSNNQLLSVPYALHAKTVENTEDADADSTNEIQSLSLTGRTITLSKNGGIADLNPEFTALETKLAADSLSLGNAINANTSTISQNAAAIAADMDADSTNEIQSIYDSGDTLYLSKNGGFLFFGPITTPWTKESNGIHYSGNVALNSAVLDYPLLVADTFVHSNTSMYRNGIYVASKITNSSGADYAGVHSEVDGTASTNTAVDATSMGSSSGTNYGVGGYARNAATNVGVEGFVGSNNSENYGIDVYVRSGSENYGINSFVRSNTSDASQNVAIKAQTQASSGNARAMWARAYGSNPGTAIFTEATSDSSNYGLRSYAVATSGNSSAQYGLTSIARGSSTGGGTGSGNFFGALTEAQGSGTFNTGISTYAEGATPQINRGVEAISSPSTNARYGQAVFALSDGADDGNANSYNAGIYAIARNNTQANYAGVFETNGQGDLNFGSANYSYGSNSGAKINIASYAWSANADTNIAFYGDATSTGADLTVGVYGEAANALTNFAGYFEGNVVVTGNLDVTGSISKGSGTFKIDHPSDPENKYLVHSFVESPEMLNVYSGNIQTDANGHAEVLMPDYFGDNNSDFRYQLTVIGAFAQAIVAEELVGNRFSIRTDKPNIKVSWQVTAKRNDPYAKKYPIEAVQEKPAEMKGTYLHPELYGKPNNMRSFKGFDINPRSSSIENEEAKSKAPRVKDDYKDSREDLKQLEEKAEKRAQQILKNHGE